MIESKIDTWICNQCGYKQDFKSDKCPNCKSKMAKVTNDIDKITVNTLTPVEIAEHETKRQAFEAKQAALKEAEKQ